MASHEELQFNFETNDSEDLVRRPDLSDLEENYRTLVENAPEIFFIIDLKGKFILLNQAVRRITGHTTHTIIEKDFQSLVAPEHKDKVIAMLNEAPQGITNPYFEVEIISSNGNRIPLEVHIKAVRDRKKRIAALRGVARDITERKKIEAALKASEEKFSELAERAKDGVVIVQDGICKSANKATAQILGYNIGEFVGKRFFEWFPSKGKEILAQRHKQRLAGEEVPASFKTKILHKEGDIKDIEFSSSVVQFEGRPAEMGIIQDISGLKYLEKSLKRAEEKYQILVENINDIIFMIDPGGKFTFISASAAGCLGYSPEEITGKPFSDYVHAEDLATYETNLKKILEGKNESHELRLLDNEGNIHHMRISSGAMVENGEPVGILGIASDVTDRKNSFDELSQACRAVENTKSQLKSIIDKAPNVAIQGYNDKGKVIFWNKFSEKLLGFTENEIKGKPFKGILASEEDETKFQELIQEVFHTQKPSSLREWKARRNSGEEKHILSSIFPVAQPEQEPIVVAMIMDITDQKKAEEKILRVSSQFERFSKISAAILSIENEKELFEYIAKAVTDISDFSRVLISYFIDEPPFREIIAYQGVRKADLDRVKKVEMPKEKYLGYFDRGIKIGNQSCFIPALKKDILDLEAVVTSERSYSEKENGWQKDDNLLVAMKDTQGEIIGMISVDDSKSGKAPTEETVRPLEIFANLISETIQKSLLANKIKESEEKYRELLSNIKIGVFRGTPKGEILEANPKALEMFGLKDTENFLSLKTCELYQNPNDNGFFMKEIEENGIVQHKDFLMKKKDGETFWASVTATAIRDELGKISHYDTVVEDITEQKNLQDKVKRLLVTDELTGLYNRRYFNEKLPMVIKATETFRSSLALIMVDIDDFKLYNDTYHHLEGDVVLKEIARVCYQSIRNYKDDDWVTKFGSEEFAFNDWAARFGGDEFIIVLPGQNADDAALVAERVRKAFEKTAFVPKVKDIHKTVSMGIASCFYADGKVRKGKKKRIFPPDYEKAATELTKLADTALFEAKKRGKNQTAVSKTSIELSRTETKSNKSKKQELS
jgi:PAS domain S-box-containing protein